MIDFTLITKFKNQFGVDIYYNEPGSGLVYETDGNCYELDETEIQKIQESLDTGKNLLKPGKKIQYDPDCDY